MIIDEQYFIEATFKGKAHLEKHFNAHVLKENEQFDSNNPKFPHNMTIKDYYNEAEKLSLEKAGNSEDKHSEVVGWVNNKSGWPHPRKIKIRRHSKWDSSCRDVVVYVDDEKTGNNVITFYLGQPRVLFREKQYYLSELPENEGTLTTTDYVEKLNNI